MPRSTEATNHPARQPELLPRLLEAAGPARSPVSLRRGTRPNREPQLREIGLRTTIPCDAPGHAHPNVFPKDERSRQPPVVEFFVEVGAAGTDVQLHETGGPAVIHNPLARIETVPAKDGEPYSKQWLSGEQSRVLCCHTTSLAQITRHGSAFWKTSPPGSNPAAVITALGSDHTDVLGPSPVSASLLI